MTTEEKRREMCKEVRRKDIQELNEISKVLDFPKADTIEQYAEDVKNMILEKCGKAAVLIKAGDGLIYADYWQCGMGDMFEFSGNINLDAIHKSIKANYVTPEE